MQVAIFYRPMWFAADVQVELWLDTELIHQGSLVAGAVHQIELVGGTHVLEARAGFGLGSRKRSWTLDVPHRPDTAHVLELVYDRWRGNFKKTLALREGLPPELPATATGLADEAVAELPSYPVRATWIILTVLVGFMGLELLLPVTGADGAAPSIATLDGFGGLGALAVQSHDFYRFIACTFLHADPLHLAFNAFSLAMGGSLVERKLGAYWFVVLYALSGLGGSLMSFALNKGDMISVGASGAILGIFAAGMVLAEAYPAAQRMPLRGQLARVLVPSLLPLFNIHGGKIDFGAHLGGAMAGALVGWALLRKLRHDAEHALPTHQSRVAQVATAAILVVTLLAFGRVATAGYPQARVSSAVLAQLIPNSELNLLGPTSAAQYATWKTKYPNDPRVLIWSAWQALDHAEPETFDSALREGKAAVAQTAALFDDKTRQSFMQQLIALEGERAKLWLVPNDQLPNGSKEHVHAQWTAKLPELKAKFPHDPRVQYEAAFRDFDANDPEAALLDIASARAAEPAIRPFFDKPIDLSFLAALEALSLRKLGRDVEARQVEARVCAGADGENAQGALRKRGFCK